MGLAIFRNEPGSVEIQSFMGRAIHASGTAPQYLISDKGPQFWPTRGYKRWCRAHGIKPRFWAIWKHGSIAIIERAIRSLKESTRRIVVSSRREAMRRALDTIVG